jgi:hypothetical protein
MTLPPPAFTTGHSNVSIRIQLKISKKLKISLFPPKLPTIKEELAIHYSKKFSNLDVEFQSPILARKINNTTVKLPHLTKISQQNPRKYHPSIIIVGP